MRPLPYSLVHVEMLYCTIRQCEPVGHGDIVDVVCRDQRPAAGMF
jgi:hypothetical protein